MVKGSWPYQENQHTNDPFFLWGTTSDSERIQLYQLLHSLNPQFI